MCMEIISLTDRAELAVVVKEYPGIEITAMSGFNGWGWSARLPDNRSLVIKGFGNSGFLGPQECIDNCINYFETTKELVFMSFFDFINQKR